MLGVTVTVPAPVPLAGETLSQLALSDAAQEDVPPTLSVFGAGRAPPAVPLKDSEAGDTVSVGGDGAPDLNATAAISHGVLAPVDTRAAGVSPVLPVVPSTSNSMSAVGETFTRSLHAGSPASVRE